MDHFDQCYHATHSKYHCAGDSSGCIHLTMQLYATHSVSHTVLTTVQVTVVDENAKEALYEQAATQAGVPVICRKHPLKDLDRMNPKTADAVVIISRLQEVEDVSTFLKAVHKVLKTGGRCVQALAVTRAFVYSVFRHLLAFISKQYVQHRYPVNKSTLLCACLDFLLGFTSFMSLAQLHLFVTPLPSEQQLVTFMHFLGTELPGKAVEVKVFMQVYFHSAGEV